jgi:hypothetical protein
MKIITARNVHQALPEAVWSLRTSGVERDSRNGKVLIMPTPVTTVYLRPVERVLFWPERDANPFFHLLESMWMLSGRRDIEPLTKIVKRMQDFSDDGIVQHGAYGHRWRVFFGKNQLRQIISQLEKNREDRRCVLQMWDAREDLGRNGRDVPCNTTATFQINSEGALDLAVFCRSNDIVWGAYGANAVHFSFLLEYVATCLNVPIGRYYQISVNWHGYLDTFQPLSDKLPRLVSNHDWESGDCYYACKLVRPELMLTDPRFFRSDVPALMRMEKLDEEIAWLLYRWDSNFDPNNGRLREYQPMFFQIAEQVLAAHHAYSIRPAPERFDVAGSIFAQCPQDNDWVRAAQEWVMRRFATWTEKMSREKSNDVLQARK